MIFLLALISTGRLYQETLHEEMRALWLSIVSFDGFCQDQHKGGGGAESHCNLIIELPSNIANGIEKGCEVVEEMK